MKLKTSAMQPSLKTQTLETPLTSQVCSTFSFSWGERVKGVGKERTSKQNKTKNAQDLQISHGIMATNQSYVRHGPARPVCPSSTLVCKYSSNTTYTDCFVEGTGSWYSTQTPYPIMTHTWLLLHYIVYFIFHVSITSYANTHMLTHTLVHNLTHIHT